MLNSQTKKSNASADDAVDKSQQSCVAADNKDSPMKYLDQGKLMELSKLSDESFAVLGEIT